MGSLSIPAFMSGTWLNAQPGAPVATARSNARIAAGPLKIMEPDSPRTSAPSALPGRSIMRRLVRFRSTARARGRRHDPPRGNGGSQAIRGLVQAVGELGDVACPLARDLRFTHERGRSRGV